MVFGRCGWCWRYRRAAPTQRRPGGVNPNKKPAGGLCCTYPPTPGGVNPREKAAGIAWDAVHSHCAYKQLAPIIKGQVWEFHDVDTKDRRSLVAYVIRHGFRQVLDPQWAHSLSTTTDDLMGVFGGRSQVMSRWISECCKLKLESAHDTVLSELWYAFFAFSTHHLTAFHDS
jgi:hypothetical protein